MRESLLFAVLALLVACQHHYEVSEIAGTYSALVDDGVDTIELNPNGKYRHIYITKSGKLYEQVNAWALLQDETGERVSLDHFRVPDHENVAGEAYFCPSVARRIWGFGSIYLETDPDHEEGYDRLK